MLCAHLFLIPIGETGWLESNLVNTYEEIHFTQMGAQSTQRVPLRPRWLRTDGKIIGWYDLRDHYRVGSFTILKLLQFWVGPCIGGPLASIVYEYIFKLPPQANPNPNEIADDASQVRLSV